MKQRPAIVIPGFRRSQSLARLLASIQVAVFDDPPPVIVSLEGGASAEVEKVAESFAKAYPNAIIRRHDTRLGLRAHILQCGDYSIQYGSVIVLEDDLLVDPYFYKYTSEALEFYYDMPDVAGIALYSPAYNEFAALPFTPMDNGYDTYAMRTACSWGQAWSDRQWTAFREWYATADAATVSDLNRLPQAVRRWPETSWKKYFAAYISLQQKDFIYPFRSVVTNCSDAGGEHVKAGTNLLQVPLGDPRRPAPTYRFDPRHAPLRVAYDEFMEAAGAFVHECLNLGEADVEVDLYGLKPVELLRRKTFAATVRPAANPRQVFALGLRPIELSLRFPVAGLAGGAGIRLVETAQIQAAQHTYSVDELSFHTGTDLARLRNSVVVAATLPRAISNRIVSKVRRK